MNRNVFFRKFLYYLVCAMTTAFMAISIPSFAGNKSFVFQQSNAKYNPKNLSKEEIGAFVKQGIQPSGLVCYTNNGVEFHPSDQQVQQAAALLRTWMVRMLREVDKGHNAQCPQAMCLNWQFDDKGNKVPLEIDEQFVIDALNSDHFVVKVLAVATEVTLASADESTNPVSFGKNITKVLPAGTVMFCLEYPNPSNPDYPIILVFAADYCGNPPMDEATLNLFAPSHTQPARHGSAPSQDISGGNHTAVAQNGNGQPVVNVVNNNYNYNGGNTASVHDVNAASAASATNDVPYGMSSQNGVPQYDPAPTVIYGQQPSYADQGYYGTQSYGYAPQQGYYSGPSVQFGVRFGSGQGCSGGQQNVPQQAPAPRSVYSTNQPNGGTNVGRNVPAGHMQPNGGGSNTGNGGGHMQPNGGGRNVWKR